MTEKLLVRELQNWKKLKYNKTFYRHIKKRQTSTTINVPATSKDILFVHLFHSIFQVVFALYIHYVGILYWNITNKTR